MTARRTLRLAVLPLLTLAVGALAWLGFVMLRESFSRGFDGTWLLVWVLAFLVGMPLLILGLAIAGAVQRHELSRILVPYSGETIPGAGQ